jgi:hypothetical protein
MDFRPERVESAFARLDALVGGLAPHASAAARGTIERWRADVAALRYHLRRRPQDGPPVFVLLGGTGTGKSTMVNRILGQNISATSFRRTFTAGAVAIAAKADNVPAGWLNIEHQAIPESELPAKGKVGALIIVPLSLDLTRHLTLVDTPDLDGDTPSHHAEADRAFRWADAVLFLVTPEKYQMTELLPYYRLAGRYGLPAVFLMNKCEQQAIADDYANLLRVQTSGTSIEAGAGFADRKLYVVPRDDAGYEPPPEQNLQALQANLLHLGPTANDARALGLSHRGEDLLGRLHDQIVSPLREDRKEIDRLITVLRGMESPVPGVDVNPLTQQLQRRMQQRSVLYLMGPQRILDRVRQAPGLLVRLPRVAWDYVMRGDVSAAAFSPTTGTEEDPNRPPDFQTILTDQFAVLQSRLDDALRSSPTVQRWAAAAGPPPWQSALFDSADAGKIADEELAELKRWLEQRWNATPRDTRMLESLLKFLPGGKKITQWTETAPYLVVLIAAAATHHLFGGVDLIVLGGWSLATWISERLSNEVSAHARETNQRITDRFARLAHDQIDRLTRWLNDQAPSQTALEQLEGAMDSVRDQIAPS